MKAKRDLETYESVNSRMDSLDDLRVSYIPSFVFYIVDLVAHHIRQAHPPPTVLADQNKKLHYSKELLVQSFAALPCIADSQALTTYGKVVDGFLT